MRNRKRTTAELTEEQAIKLLSQRGFSIVKNPTKPQKTVTIDINTFKGDKVKIGMIGDTHLGSQFQQLTHLKTFYQLCAEEDIDHIIHAGDAVAGNGKVYRGQEYELHKHGADAQREYVVKNYPQGKGITTHMISGNHDLSFDAGDGYDIIAAIAEKRKDIDYLGKYGAYIEVGGIKIYVMHGDGGNAYALSYKIQKILEQLPSENKPHIVLVGHYHTSVLVPMYRNMCGLLAGCFEAQTPYLKRKALRPTIGGWIIEISKKDINGVILPAAFNFRFIPFYTPIENDY